MKKKLEIGGKTALLVLLIVAVCTGIAFAQTPKIPQELVGKWKLVAIGSAVIIEFTEDGRIVYSSVYSASVQVNENRLEITWDDGQTGSAKFKLNKDTLKISGLKGNTGLPIGSFKRQ